MKPQQFLGATQLSWRGSSAYDCTICDKREAEGSNLHCFSHCHLHPTSLMFASSDQDKLLQSPEQGGAV